MAGDTPLNDGPALEPPGAPENQGMWRWLEKAFAALRAFGERTCAWLRDYAGRLRRHFFGAEYTDIYRNDDHLQAVASKLFQRSRRYSDVSMILLVCAVAMIIIGVAVFLFPTRFADAPAAKVDEHDDLIDAYLKPQNDLRKAREFQFAVAPFYETYRETKLAQEGARAFASGAQIRHAAALLNAIQSEAEQFELAGADSSYFTSGLRGDMTITKATLDELNAMITNGTTGGAAELLQVILALETSVTDESGRADAHRAAALQLAWAEQAWEAAERRNEIAVAAASAQSANEASLLKKIHQLTREIAKEEISGGQSGGLTEASSIWFSVLSVRVGIVVLLVFLSQVFLATYRYTMSLSAFYRARGDALQLASRETQADAEQLIDPQELQELLTILAPDQLKVDATDSPELSSVLRGGR